MRGQGPETAGNRRAPVAAPVLWGIADVMSVLGVSRTTAWLLAKKGLLGPKVFIGRNPKWQVVNVMAYASKGDA
jgi:predicted DNA-binding transcriptional regulator AlpA